MYKLTHIYKSFADKQVLSDINLTLHNEVVALIGENGAGKTTLLKILLGELKADEGQVQQSGAVGYVPQNPDFKDTIAECFNEDIEQWRIDIALDDVGLEKSMDFLTSKLSGGQKTRLAIAMVLASDPSPRVLLLDEPTNNLDTQALRWLEGYIKSFKGAVVVVSHDRNFINRTCNRVLELKNGRISAYSGNYDDYRTQKEIEAQQAQAAYEAGAAERKRLQTIIVQKRSDSDHTHKHIKRSDNDKAQRDYFKNRVTRGLGQQVRSMQTRLDQLDDLEKPDRGKNYKVSLDGYVRKDKLILNMEDISVSFLTNIKNFNLEIHGSERIFLSGPNGSGKSTLMRVANGQAKPDNGTISVGVGVTIGYLSQEIDGLNSSLSALENLEKTDASKTDIYREARALGLTPDDLRKKPRDLSRGQQSKLSFAKLLLGEHELLILDEPTNHLDIPTREVIDKALQKYKGAMLIASHDEYFVKQIHPTKTIQLYNETMQTGRLILLCGLPGSGKSTLAKEISKAAGAVVMSPDQEMQTQGISFFDEKARAYIEAKQWQKSLQLTSQGKTVVLEFGFWGREERDKLREEAHARSLKIELHYLEVPFDELWERVKKRNAKEASWNDALLTKKQLKEAHNSMEAPTKEELKLFDN